MQGGLALGPYYYDVNNKLLLCKDKLIATGDEALAYAVMLGSWTEWTRVRCRTPMNNKSNRSDEEPVMGMGHSSNRRFDRYGVSLDARPSDLTRELYEIEE